MHHLPPSFFIIGERKCATSSLYRYLIDHPQILPCRLKEPQFFSRPLWYRILFAGRYRAMYPEEGSSEMKMQWFDLNTNGGIVRQELLIRCETREKIITGEASANTFAQVPPQRLKRAYPEARLILCLRHPVDRAYSHYRMLQRFSEEGRRVPIHLTDFASDIQVDLARAKKGGQGYFAGLSLYAERVNGWAKVFGKERLFIVRTEDLQHPAATQDILSTLCRYLSIRDHDFTGITQLMVNRASKASLDPDLRQKLFTNYEQDVRALEEFTGRQFNWNP